MKHQQDFIFALIPWLWMVPLLAIGGYSLWKIWNKIARQRLQRFIAPKLFSSALPAVHWKGRAYHIAACVAVLMLLAIVLARPLYGPSPEHAENKGVDFVVLLDVSKSMWVEDLPPNRLTVVKKELSDFIKNLSGDRMGLVLFAGDAFVQAPVTFDYKALDYVLQQAGPKSISLGGTNIPRAVEMASHLLEKSESGGKFVVIVSDGENLEGDALNSVRQARTKDGLTIFTVGVGTLGGGKVPSEDYANKPAPADGKPVRKNYISNEYGLGVTSRLDSRALRLLAEAGGGRYYELKPGLKTFETLYTQSLLPQARKNRAIDVREYEELFQIPLGCAILLLVFQALIPLVKKRTEARASGVAVIMPETFSKASGPRLMIRARKAARKPVKVLVVLFLFSLAISGAPLGAAVWDRAEELLKEGKKDEAVDFMRQEVQKNEKDPWLFYNYALTLYRAEKYEESVNAFQALRQSEQGVELLEKSSLQMGNAQVKLGEKLQKSTQLPEAILALERALTYYDESYVKKPGQETQNNRQVASVKLEDCLMKAGKRFKESADKAQGNPGSEEQSLRNALQAFERITELNEANTEAPRQVAELRERLAQNLAKQAAEISKQADAIQADAKKKPEESLSKRQQAVTKLDEALTYAPENQPIQQQKKAEQDKMSDLLTDLAEKQVAKSMEKEKPDMGDQSALNQAKGKLDQAIGLNPDNQKAQDLSKKVQAKLEQSHVEEGQKALAQIEKGNNPQAKLADGNRAADQFQKALALNPENKDAQKGLAEANAKLPGLFADSGDAEAAKGKEAMKGQASAPKPGAPGKPAPGAPGSPGSPGAPGAPSAQDMQKAVGFLEKADQNYGMALGMTPQDSELQKRAEAVRAMLSETRDQLDAQNRANMESSPSAPGSEQAGTDGLGEPKPGEGADTPTNTTHKLLSMADLGGKGKPNTGDNFWEKKIRDW